MLSIRGTVAVIGLQLESLMSLGWRGQTISNLIMGPIMFPSKLSASLVEGWSEVFIESFWSLNCLVTVVLVALLGLKNQLVGLWN